MQPDEKIRLNHSGAGPIFYYSIMFADGHSGVCHLAARHPNVFRIRFFASMISPIASTAVTV
jgi:hypothetical protein